MLVCATCGSRWDERSGPATTFAAADCPLCGGELLEIDDPAWFHDSEPVHAGVGRLLRENLLDVGA